MKDDLKRSSVKIILSLIILVIASIAFIFLKPESMASRFKLEYESLNGQKTDDGREYMEVNINNDNKIVYADYKTIVEGNNGYTRQNVMRLKDRFYNIQPDPFTWQPGQVASFMPIVSLPDSFSI